MKTLRHPDESTETPPVNRFAFDLSWTTIGRVILAAALVWCLLQLTSLALLLLIAVILAVTLEPVVRWAETHRIPRWIGSSVVVLALVSGILGFAYLASAQLTEQGKLVGSRLQEVEGSLLGRLPPSWLDMFSAQHAAASVQSYVAQAGLTLVGSVARALTYFALAAILTLYLLIEGELTYAWLLAFVPRGQRQKVSMTAAECQRVIFGYLAGNIATSICAAIFVYVSLKLLHVPAALLLALLAAVCDFVPVLGFAVSSLPAIALAATVSPTATASVAVLYVVYHSLENYLIAPYIYGDRLRLSNVAVVIAFAVGAELAGVAGALLALPIAAAYPAIERIWLRDRLGDQVVEEHRAIEHRDDEPPAVSATARAAGGKMQ